MLLYFTVRNFRSFRDEAELSMTSAAMRTNIPKAGQAWIDCTVRVAAIFGGNAAGKTTVVEALAVLARAIRKPGAGGIRDPYLWSPEDEPTSFSVGFVVDGVRYDYSLSAMSWGITREVLYASPKGSRRLIFERTQESRDGEVALRKGASLTGPTSEVHRLTRSRMLFLAVANKYGHPVLAGIASGLLLGSGISSVSFRQAQDGAVVQRVILEMLKRPETEDEHVRAVLQVADLGISSVQVKSEEIPKDVQAKIRRLLEALEDGEVGEDDEINVPQISEIAMFSHVGPDGAVRQLPLHKQSSGTLTWLTLSWHALQALQAGSVLLVDEIDASLHATLVRTLVSMFSDPALNPRGAQLIFTTHDVALLGNSPTKLLAPQTVWFVEKGDDGASVLYCLDDFENRPGNNSERRYLAGQFGAIPNMDGTLLFRYLAELIGGDGTPIGSAGDGTRA